MKWIIHYVPTHLCNPEQYKDSISSQPLFPNCNLLLKNWITIIGSMVITMLICLKAILMEPHLLQIKWVILIWTTS